MSNVLNYMYIYYTKLEKKKFEILEINKNLNFIGVYDESTNIWIHAWAIYTYIEQYNFYKKSRDLLKYAINMDIDTRNLDRNNIIVRSILINSKIYIDNNEKDLQLNIIVGVISYLLKAKSYDIIET